MRLPLPLGEENRARDLEQPERAQGPGAGKRTSRSGDPVGALRGIADGVVLLSGTDWEGSRQRPHHMAERFARALPTWFVETTGLRSISLADIPRLCRRFGRLLKTRPRSAVPSALEVVRPRFVPLQSSALLGRVNGAWVARQVGVRLNRAQVRRPLVIVNVPGPISQALAGIAGCVGVVYDCMDDYALFHRKQELVQEAEQRLLQVADLVIGSSQALVDRLTCRHPRVKLVRNGADVAHFSRVATDPPPSELKHLSGPIAGFFGTVASWFDNELLARLAAAAPNWQFAIVGPVHLSSRQLPMNPNIHWLGPRPYEELPGIGRCFDACLIPFRINEITRSVDPIKIYEYLALGKPVIATPLPELEPLHRWVHIASDAEAFAAALQRLSTRETPGEYSVGAAREIERSHTWDVRWETMVSHIVDAITRS